jgi:hypothetical protein
MDTNQNKPNTNKLPKRRKRNKDLRFALMVIAVLFILGAIAWRAQGPIIYAKIIKTLENMDPRSYQGRNVALNCMDKYNKNTPYCQDRAARSEANWEGISRNKSGRTNAFGLSER